MVVKRSMLNLFEDLYQHFKQRAAIYPNISVSANCGVDFCTIIISKTRAADFDTNFHGIVITPGHIYYQIHDFRLKWSDDIVKKVEWYDPKMLETIDGWMREMAL